jgi:hypothetical protein
MVQSSSGHDRGEPALNSGLSTIGDAPQDSLGSALERSVYLFGGGGALGTAFTAFVGR